MKLVKIITFAFFFTLINVMITNFVIGGDALSGKIENNKYYIWDATLKYNSSGDAIYKEVSKNIYYYSLSITYLFFLLIPFFIFSAIKYNIHGKSKK